MILKQNLKRWLFRRIIRGYLIESWALCELDGIPIAIDTFSRLDDFIARAVFSFLSGGEFSGVDIENAKR